MSKRKVKNIVVSSDDETETNKKRLRKIDESESEEDENEDKISQDEEDESYKVEVSESEDEDGQIKVDLSDWINKRTRRKEDPLKLKCRIVSSWLNKINPEERGKYRLMANMLYDHITDTPTHAEIMQSKMPFREKCMLFEQLEILGQTHPGTFEYFSVKKDIHKILNEYKNLPNTTEDIETIDNKLECAVINAIPQRLRILTSDVSEHNKKILLDKYNLMITYCSDGTTYGKLHEWIEWGLSISDKVIPIPVQVSDGSAAINKYLYDVKVKLDAKLYGMQKIKETLLELLATRITNPNAKELSIGLLGAPGVGKCLHPNTCILLYGGGYVLAKNVRIGDKLIGDDNEPRTVLSVCAGEDIMYKISTVHHGSFIVNQPHILTLRNPETFEIVDVSLKDYLEHKESKYANYVMFTVPVKYGVRNLADGDIETLAMKVCKTLMDVRFSVSLPNDYVYSDYRLRRCIIKNLMNFANTPIRIYHEPLGHQLVFMCRSIGVNALYEQHTLTFYSADDIQIDDVYNVPFTVELLGIGPYCGFTLDGNGRFMLENCIITHNTHLVQVLAEAINLPFCKINMGGHVDSHQFLGHGFTYEGAQPGIIVKGLKQMKSKSGIIYLDEFDKIASNSDKVEHTFLHISDPVQQGDFQDHYMPEIKIDLSYIMFIYSFNFRENINPVLLDRIPIIEVMGYTPKDKYHIIKSYIIPEALQNIGMTANEINFNDEAIYYIINSSVEEGMRRVKQDIQNIIKRVNMLKICSCTGGSLKLSYDLGKPLITPFTVDVDCVRRLENEKKKEKYLDLYL